MTAQVKCPYCGNKAELVGGKVIYPHRSDLYKLYFWRCAPCGAYTGTHKDSKRHASKGRLANAELRQARSAAHAAFDPMWRDGNMTRRDAYEWLQKALGMHRQPHIGFMDVDQCRRVVEVCGDQTAHTFGADSETGKLT